MRAPTILGKRIPIQEPRASFFPSRVFAIIRVYRHALAYVAPNLRRLRHLVTSPSPAFHPRDWQKPPLPSPWLGRRAILSHLKWAVVVKLPPVPPANASVRVRARGGGLRNRVRWNRKWHQSLIISNHYGPIATANYCYCECYATPTAVATATATATAIDIAAGNYHCVCDRRAKSPRQKSPALGGAPKPRCRERVQKLCYRSAIAKGCYRSAIAKGPPAPRGA